MARGAPAAFAAGTNLPWDENVGPTHLVKRTGGEQNLVAHKVAPANVIARLRAQIRILTAKNKALAAQAKAAAAEAKYQADRNTSLGNYIGELNKRLMKYEGVEQQPDTADPDKESTTYSICTPEQDCRINGYGCGDAQPAPQPVDQLKQDGGSI